MTSEVGTSDTIVWQAIISIWKSICKFKICKTFSSGCNFWIYGAIWSSIRNDFSKAKKVPDVEFWKSYALLQIKLTSYSKPLNGRLTLRCLHLIFLIPQKQEYDLWLVLMNVQHDILSNMQYWYLHILPNVFVYLKSLSRWQSKVL